MRCPRCPTSSLFERDRDGVTIDICEACRGIWLDRGELEKLIARARREDLDSRRVGEPDDDRDDSDWSLGGRDTDESLSGPTRDRSRPSRFPRDDDERGRPAGPPRKRRWYESLGDLFD